MLIINADDWGRTIQETDVAFECFRVGCITSATGMVFMQDSVRAGEIARANQLPIGLHLNLSQSYTQGAGRAARKSHEQIVQFMQKSRFAMYFYHPGLRGAFRDVFRSQVDEFYRLYGRAPTHIDGHQHRHLCANMLLEEVIPRGYKIRRNFTYLPREKHPINRSYRKAVDWILARRYILTQYFFSLSDCHADAKLQTVFHLASSVPVEIMTHPIYPHEHSLLFSRKFNEEIRNLPLATYNDL